MWYYVRRVLLWASKRLRCLAHRLDRWIDWTCEKQDPRELAAMVQKMMLDRHGVAIPDEVIDLIIRFGKVENRLKDQNPDFAESYLISKLQSALPLEIRRQLVEELEKEVGI